jgi:hypothetical protein
MTLEEKLNKIFNHFGGRENKLEKLFEEAGEYRDRYVLNKQSPVLEAKIIKEICDIKSCVDQLYNNEQRIRDAYEPTIDETLRKISEKYYEK